MSVVNTELKNQSSNVATDDSLVTTGSRFFYIAVLGIWLGAMIFFSFFFAPAAFQIIPSRHLTGTLVTALLTKLNIGTLILVPLLIISSFTQRQDLKPVWSRATFTQLLLLVLMALSSALSQFYFTPKMVKLRAQMVSID
ncbi:MAG: DUF4149 domain-containing protein, partial [Acidobacteriota bacterium]